jgi:hypothetical protein
MMRCPACGHEFEPEKKLRGTRLGDKFYVTSPMREWASAHVPLIDVREETPKFCDYWRAMPGQRGVKLDWLATWRNWMREAQSRLPVNKYAGNGNGSRAVRETESPDAYVHNPAPMPANLRALIPREEQE